MSIQGDGTEEITNQLNNDSRPVTPVLNGDQQSSQQEQMEETVLNRSQGIHVENLGPEDQASDAQEPIGPNPFYSEQPSVKPKNVQQVNDDADNSGMVHNMSPPTDPNVFLQFLLSQIESGELVFKGGSEKPEIRQIPPMTNLARQLAQHLSVEDKFIPSQSNIQSHIQPHVQSNVPFPVQSNIQPHMQSHVQPHVQPQVFYNRSFDRTQYASHVNDNLSHDQYRPKSPPKMSLQFTPSVDSTNPQSYADMLNVVKNNQLNNRSPVQVFSQTPIIPPDLPVFTNNNLRSFNRFLVYIQNHCVQYYPNNPGIWPQILLKQLSKEIRSTLHADAEYDWDFDRVVEALRDYFALIGPKEDQSPDVIFLRMFRKPNESVTHFSVKLLQAFKLAYPSTTDNFSHSKVLLAKFIENLPGEIKSFVINSTLIHQSVGDPPSYRSHVVLAEKYEKELKAKEQAKNVQPQATSSNSNVYKKPYHQYSKISQNDEMLAINEMNPSLEIPFSQMNLSVPPPHVNHSYHSFSNDGHPMPYETTSTDANGYPSPIQQAFLRFEQTTRGPPKQKKPGVCNYCDHPGHYRNQCQLLKLREGEPEVVWCERCKLKNHLAIHCTYKPPAQREPAESRKDSA